MDNEERIRFDRPIQAIREIEKRLNIPRDTIRKAFLRGEIADCAYMSGQIWLIDTDCQQFQHWLISYLDKKRRGRVRPNAEVRVKRR